MSRPSSRNQSTIDGDSTPGFQRASTVAPAKSNTTRPAPLKSTSTTSATRPGSIADRLSKPTATSAARNAPANKLTTSNATPRRPVLASTFSSTGSLHRAQTSTASTDAKVSDNEIKDESHGIAARPKRMSTISSTTDRLASTRTTASSRQPAPAPVRRTSTATSASTFRAGAASPALSRSSAISPTPARAPSALSKHTSTTSILRSKPTSTASRTAPSNVEKKRLSTIQGTPTSRSAQKKFQHDLASEGEKGSSRPTRPLRPPLGTRKSTNSVLMEQQIREFELVSQMLQSAMDVEGRDAAEQLRLETEAAETMTKLRTTLGKVRKFEKQHGRVPSLDELAEISSVDLGVSDLERGFDPGESMISASASVSGDHAHTLREELNESRAYTGLLEQQIDDMTSKLKDFEESLELEGGKAREVVEQAEADHIHSVREVSSANQARLDHLRTVHYEELRELREQHEEDLVKLRTDQESDLSSKDDELQRLQDQIKQFNEDAQSTAKSRESADAARDEQVRDLTQQLDTLNQEKLDDARKHKDELEKVQAEKDVLVESKNEAENLASRLSEVQNELQLLKSQKPDTSDSDAEIVDLKLQIDQLKSAKPDTAIQDMEILKLQAELAEVSESASSLAQKTDEIEQIRIELDRERATKADVSKLETEITRLTSDLNSANVRLSTVADQDAVITSLRAALEEAKQITATAMPQPKNAETPRPAEELNNSGVNNRPASSASTTREMSPVKSDAEKEELRKRLDALERRHQAAKDNAKSKSAKQAEEHATKFAQQLTEHETALATTRALLKQLETDMEAKQVELEQLQVKRVAELGKLQEQITVQAAELDNARESTKSFGKTEAELMASLSTIDELHKQLQNVEAARQKSELAADDALSSVKDLHANELKSLQEQLTSTVNDLEQHKASSSEQSVSKESEHKEHMDAAERKLVQLQLDLETTISAGEAKASQEILSLKGVLESTQEQLISIRHEHDKTVQELEAKLERANAEALTSSNEFESRISQLTHQSESTLKTHNNATADLQIQLDSANLQYAELQSAMGALRLSHADEMTEAVQKIRDTHENHIAKLKSAHDKRLSQLEEEGRAAITGLDEIDRAHNARFEKLEADAIAAQEAALAEQIQTHSAALMEVSLKHRGLQEDFEALKVNHADEVEKLRISHHTELESLNALHNSQIEDVTIKNIAERTAALKELRDTHATKVSELETLPRGISEDELAALKNAHAEQVRELESQSGALSSQMQSAQFSLRTLKGILADTDRQAEEKEKEHAKELQFEKDQFSQAIIKISNHGSQLMQKDIEHSAALEKVRQEMQEAHDKVVDTLKSDHASVVEQVVAKMETENTALRESLREDHEKALVAFKQSSQTKDLDIDKLRAEHADALAKSMDAVEKTHQETAARVVAEHATQLDALRRELDLTQQSSLKEATDAHQAVLTNLREKSETGLATIKREHQEAVKQLQAQLATAESKITDNTTKSDLTDATLAETRLALAEAQKAHQDAVYKIHSDHEKTLAKTKAAHEEEMGRLQDEYSKARAVTDQLASEADQVGTLSSTVDELKKHNNELIEKHSLLAREVETHSKRADKAEKEIGEMRKTASMATEVSGSPVPSAKDKSATSSIVSSPQLSSGGLGTSKWAAAEAADRLSEGGQVHPEFPSLNLGFKRRTNSDVASASGRNKNEHVSERNVHGQLAGINEDIRELNYLSERMLAENQRLAKTLSLVNDDTGRVDTVTVDERS